MAQIDGTADNDSLSGDTGPDTIHGLDGADTLWGSDGHDRVYGDDGDDLISDSNGTDTLDGGQGVDTLSMFYGTFFNQSIPGFAFTFKAGGAQKTPGGSKVLNFEQVNITGSDFNDTITGGVNADTLRGWQGSDWLNGGRGDDFMIGDNGADTLIGGKGNDFLSGGGHDDVLWGGIGDDTLRGSGNSDLYSGSDLLVGGAGADLLIGGNGGPTDISYADSAQGVFVDLTLRVAYGGDAQGDTFQGGFRTLTGSAFSDFLVGGAELDGGAGADRLMAGAGTRSMTGGDGADVFALQFDKKIIWEHTVITDFDQGAGERIDLSRIDPHPGDGGPWTFTFIATAAFDHAGQVRYEVVDDRTMIEINTDKDFEAEHSYFLDGVYTLTAADFGL